MNRQARPETKQPGADAQTLYYLLRLIGLCRSTIEEIDAEDCDSLRELTEALGAAEVAALRLLADGAPDGEVIDIS